MDSRRRREGCRGRCTGVVSGFSRTSTSSRGTAPRSRGSSGPDATVARVRRRMDPLETVMHRMALFAVALLLLLVAAEMRLSRASHNYSEPPPPDLWEHARPPGRWSPSPVVVRAARGMSITYPDPSTNCALIISTNPSSSYALTSADRGVSSTSTPTAISIRWPGPRPAQTLPSWRSTAMATGVSATEGADWRSDGAWRPKRPERADRIGGAD